MEANVGYDVNATQSHVELLAADTEELTRLHRNASYSCFDTSSGSPKMTSYWGGNTILRVADAGSDAANVLNTDIDSQIK